MHRVFSRRLARTHHAVNGDTGGELVGGLIGAQGLRDVSTLVKFVGVNAGHVFDTSGAQLFQQHIGQLFIRLGNDFTGVGIHNVARHHTAKQKVFGHADVAGTRLLQVTGMACSDALVFGDDDVARLVGQVEAGNFTLHALGHKFHLCTAVHQAEIVIDKEVGQDGFVVQANGLEQNRDRHLAATVHAEIQQVFGIEFKVQPRSTVGDDARRKQQLARAVGLALVVFEKYARRTVQLRNNHPLGTVDDERAFARHQGHLAHVDLLLFNFFDDFVLRGRCIAVINDQLHARAHSRRVGQTAGLAFAHIKRGLGQVVLRVLHLHKTVVRDDGECGIEGGLQALIGALLGIDIGLQKRGVRVFLHLQQVRDFQHAVAIAKVFADAFAFSKVVGHSISGQSLRSPGRLLGDCVSFLVIGHYQPLADGRALHATRPKPSSAVGIRRHSQTALAPLAGVLFSEHRPGALRHPA